MIKNPFVLFVLFWGINFFGSAQDFSIPPEYLREPPRTYAYLGLEVGSGKLMKTTGKENPYKSPLSLGVLFHLNTKLSKENPDWKLDYGLNLEVRYMGIKNNRILEDIDDVTVLEVFPHKLKKSEFQTVNILFPVEVQFGNTDSDIQDFDEIAGNLKFGLGGFFGFNVSSTMRYKFINDGKYDDISRKRSFNTENFLYGISGHVQFSFVRVFVRYHLNSIFKAAEVNGNSLAVGMALMWE